MAASDTTAPTLNNVSLPDAVDVTNRGVYASVSVGAFDTGSGVDRVFLSFDRSWQGEYGLTSGVSIRDSKDSFADGVSQDTFYIDSKTAAGTYSITSAMVYDKAGNSIFYSSNQLASMGLAKGFQVTDRNVNVDVTAVITGPSYIAEDSGQSAALTLTLFNVAQASTTVSMSFNAAGSTATNGSDVSVPSFSGGYSIAQSPAGAYTITLPSISVLRDQVVEGTEKVSVTVRASGQVFDTGTDTKTFTFDLIDSGQVGSAAADTLVGTRFADRLLGFDGNDVLTGGAGDDRIEGGAGVDTALFAGYFRQSSMVFDFGAATVTGPDGRDTLSGVERFGFADGVFVVASDKDCLRGSSP